MRTRIYLYFCAILLHLSIFGFAQDRAPVSGQGSSSPGNFPSQIQSTMQYQSIEPIGLQRYGHNFFQPDVSDQEMTSGALPRDYRLGPGDQLGIFLGGKTQENFQLAVSMDGKLYIPTIGVLFVSGLTIDEFRQVLDKKLRAFYSDYSLNIMLTMPKMVGISVIGEVRAPGNYSGSALGSILDFIVKARGVTNDGSFRNIQIIRHDSLVARIDLYDYMMRPRGRQAISLQSGDIIFVPVLASTISVSGEVNREAIYELNPNTKESVCDLVELAGGFTGLAYLQKVKISRMLRDGSRKAFYIDFKNQPCEKNDTSLVVQDKDRIHIFSIEDQAPHDSVAVYGEVNHPGFYEYHKNMRVSDLVLQAGSLKRSAYMLKAELAKVDPGNKIKMK